MTLAQRVRHIAVVVHRWTGLALAAFLIVIAATGAVLPWQVELQRIAAPERFPAVAASQRIDWVRLRAIAERLSGGRIDTMPLHRDHGAAPAFAVAGAVEIDQVILDPVTGQEIARSRVGDLAFGRGEIVPFLYRLHQNLALGGAGVLLLGIVALAWSVDCVIGFYLTLPAGRRGWWRRWRHAWTIRRPPPSRFRLHMDLHRALGLWLWPLLFVFAWTGVGFDLPQVYRPVVAALTGYAVSPDPPIATPRPPRLGWAEALMAARARAAEVATARGLAIERERELRYQPGPHVYAYAIRTDRDDSDDLANSWITIDADSGALRGVELPTGGRFGNSIDYWIGLIHIAAIFGLPLRFLVSLAGVATVIVTVTGVLIWQRKRRARATLANRLRSA